MRALLKNSRFLVGLVNACRQLGPDCRRLKWTLARRAQIETYLRENSVRKLQIGCGRNLLPGWLNTDLFPTRPGAVYLDASRPFPLPDAAFDCVFSEHIIEHLYWPDGQKMLRECQRILKPGGRIRIATPNLHNILGLAAAENSEARRRYIRLAVDNYIPHIGIHHAGFVINNFFWDFGHYFVYDPGTLQMALEKAGFTRVKACEAGQSDEPQLAGLETHGQVINAEMNRFETMILEAVKP